MASVETKPAKPSSLSESLVWVTKYNPLGQGVFSLLITLASLYVVYKCKNEVSLLEILAAIMCSPCYMVYALYLLFSKASNKGCGLLR